MGREGASHPDGSQGLGREANLVEEPSFTTGEGLLQLVHEVPHAVFRRSPSPVHIVYESLVQHLVIARRVGPASVVTHAVQTLGVIASDR